MESRNAHVVWDKVKPKTRWLARFFAGVLLGAVTVMSMQVWLNAGDFILGQIERVPFLGLLMATPFLGGFIRFVAANMSDLFGFCLWLAINLAQSGKNVVKLFDVRDPWWVARLTMWCTPTYISLAYTAEILMSYDRFPPYPGGVLGVLGHFGKWPNLANLGLLILSVLSFEKVVEMFVPKSVQK